MTEYFSVWHSVRYKEDAEAAKHIFPMDWFLHQNSKLCSCLCIEKPTAPLTHSNSVETALCIGIWCDVLTLREGPEDLHKNKKDFQVLEEFPALLLFGIECVVTKETLDKIKDFCVKYQNLKHL